MYACILPVLRVEAIMDDVIHVQVEVVVDEIAIATIRSLWFFLRGGDDPLVFHHGPPVEFRYSHGSCNDGGSRGQQVKQEETMSTGVF